MTKPYIKLEKDLIEALESHKNVFITYPQGGGKSLTALKMTSKLYKYTVFIADKHSQNDELNLTYDLSPHFFVNLFGKDFDNISPELQEKMGYPKCMCTFRWDPKYYLKKLNYLPDIWCSYPTGDRTIENLRNHCPHVFTCKHRKMIQAAIKTLKDKNFSTNITWLMVKAYLDTNMIDTFLGVKKPIGILDENILGLCSEQVELNVKTIRKFYRLADKLVEHYRYLKEMWIPFKEILKLIDNYLTYNRDENLEVKIKAISDKISEFLSSFEIDVIVSWNNKFKAAALKKIGFIRGTYNIMDLFIKILNENKNNQEFNNNITIDKDTNVLTLFISKIDRIRSIVKKFHKLLFTDALLPSIIKEMAELLQIGENYTLLGDTDSDIIFKKVNVFKLNSQRGSYSKNTLLNFLHTDIEPVPWNNLIKLSKQIIEFEAENDRKIGLIGSMKIFQSNLFSTNIQKELEDTILKYDTNVRYANYGGVAGLNKYSDVDWIILFGSYNIPQDIRKIRSKQTGISEDKLEWIYGPGTLKQMSHRGRTILRPNVVSLYSLTNMTKGLFSQEEEFYGIMELEYKDLIDEIKRHNGVSTQFCAQFLGLSRHATERRLYTMTHQEILKRGSQSVGVGRPRNVWYFNNN